MTKEELSPKRKYSWRIRTSFSLPGRELALTFEICARRSIHTARRAQRLIEYSTSSSADGSLTVSMAKVIEANGRTAFYLEQEGRFTPIDEAEAERLLAEFSSKFLERYGIAVDDEETDLLLDAMFDTAKWERF